VTDHIKTLRLAHSKLGPTGRKLAQEQGERAKEKGEKIRPKDKIKKGNYG